MYPNVTDSSYPGYFPNNQQGLLNSPQSNLNGVYTAAQSTPVTNNYIQRGHQTVSTGYQPQHNTFPGGYQQPPVGNPIMHTSVQSTPGGVPPFARTAPGLQQPAGSSPSMTHNQQQAVNCIPGLRQPGVLHTPASISPGLGHNSQQNFLSTPGIQVSTSTPFTRYNGQPVIMSPPSNISDTYTHQKNDQTNPASVQSINVNTGTRLPGPYNITPTSNNIQHNQRKSVGSGSESGKEWNIKVLIRSKDGEKRQVLTILLQEKHNPSDNSKEILIQVTDKQDPMLFYSLCIAEEDFQNVKSSQGLLVDFTSFPGMLCQLLDKCEQEGDNPSPAFILIFNIGLDTSSLDFTELNLFKHLCHLSLFISKATDSKLKEYLVSCIQLLKSELGQFRSQLSFSQQQLLEKQEQLERHVKDLESVRKEQQETSSSLNQKLVNDLQMEKENCSKKINDMQSRSEAERRDLESRHARSIDQLENRVASLDVQNRDLLEGKYRNESNIRELRGKLAAKDEELKRIEADFHALSRDKGLIDVRNREDARRVAELQKQLDNMELEVREKDAEVNKMKDMVKQSNKEREDLMVDLKDKTGTVTRRETAVRSVTEELLKANEIIGKLQDQLKQEQNKSKLRGRIAAEQEKLLSDKDKDLQGVEEKLRKIGENKDDISKEREKDLARVKELENEKDQLEKLNKSNENVINWLNKQLAEYKTAEATLGKTRTGVAIRGKTTLNAGRKSTSSEENNKASKENEPLVGLDPKYFQVSTPGGSVVTRNEIPDVRQLPTNVKRPPGGLLRR